MPEGLQRKSALEGHYNEGLVNAASKEAAGLGVSERRGLAIIQFEGRRDDGDFREAAGKALSASLPEGTCGSSGGDGRSFLWTGPNRYQAIAAESEGPAIKAALPDGLQGRHRSIIDLSQARTVFRVSGPALRDFLSKGTSIDLHPRAFPVGSVVVTQVAHVGGTIHHVSEDVFDLYVFRSFGRHVWEWMLEVGEEYGMVIEAPGN